MELRLVAREEAVKHWPTISKEFERAREHGQGESTMEDYLQKILNYNAQCWVFLDEHYNIVGASLTEIMHYSQHKTFHVILIAGVDFDQQSKEFHKMITFAKAQGCQAIEMWGRKGWTKVLPQYLPGFKEVYTVMRYDLKEQNEIH